MKRTFKEKVLGFYRRTVFKHKWLRIPLMIVSIFLLSIDRFFFNIKNNSRRIMGAAFTLTFAFVSCSFSSIIWGDSTNEFVDPAIGYYSETEKSDAELVTETVVDEQSILEADDFEADEEHTVIADGTNTFTAEDLINNFTPQNADIVDTIEENDLGFSRDDWKLILINKQHPIPENYEFTLGNIMRGMKCDERVIPELYQMIEAAYADGVNLVISSPYRDSGRQNMLFDKKINKYEAQGMSYMEAYKLAAIAVTIPDCSEHQVGLAFDITCDRYSSLNEGFANTDAGIWLKENCAEYGFIVRYPKGKEDITGIEFEPWHFRYVGKKAAQIICEENISLEEFWEKYL